MSNKKPDNDKNKKKTLDDYKVLKGAQFQINLEMQRGINDDFYYARSDNGS